MRALLVGEGRPYSGRDVAKVWGCRWRRRWRGRRRRPRSFPEELPRRAASMAGLCRGACGRPGSDRIRNRGRCGPARRTRRDGEVLMGEPAFRDCDDPADLPLFAPVPASRPGRVRSTFRCVPTGRHPRRCGGIARVAGHLLVRIRRRVGSATRAGRLGSTGGVDCVVGGAAAHAGIGRLSAQLGDGQGPGPGGSAGNRPLHHRRPAASGGAGAPVRRPRSMVDAGAGCREGGLRCLVRVGSAAAAGG